jgi:hypothetical protein
MMLSVAQRRIGLGCALLLAIAMTVVGDDKSIQVETPKPPPRMPGEPAYIKAAPGEPAYIEAAPERPARIEVAKLARVPPAAEGVDVFAAKSWSKPTIVRAAVAPLPLQPVAPPMPFQYVGRIEGREGPTVLLSRGEESFSVKAGESIDADYRLESVTEERLTIVYLPLNERQTLDPEPK